MEANATRIVAVANEKGGVGKTVTVVNIGAALAKEGKNVLIVDMDPQANATRGVGFELKEEDVSIYDVLKDPGDGAVDEAILDTRWQGLRIMPSSVNLAGSEIEFAEMDDRESLLSGVLDAMTEHFDFILMDTPPSLSLLTINVLACARELLAPCQTQPFAYGALKELFNTVELINEEINPDLRVTGILPTFFDKRTKVSRNILEKLKENETYRQFLFDSVIRANTTISESVEVGKPVVFYRSGSYGAKDYVAAAKELMGKTVD